MQRINGETIAGIALCTLGLLFVFAGMVNQTWRTILVADFVIIAIGAGFIVIGVMAIKRTNNPPTADSKGRRGYF